MVGAAVSADARIEGSGSTSRPTVVQARCPSGRGLGVASHPATAMAVATRFLRGERASDLSGLSLWAPSDPWLRHRVAPHSPSEFLVVFPAIRPGSDARRFRVRPARWLDARFGPQAARGRRPGVLVSPTADPSAGSIDLVDPGDLASMCLRSGSGARPLGGSARRPVSRLQPGVSSTSL